MEERIVGIIAGVLTSCSLIPQLIKMVKNKKADDVSTVMLLILFAGLGLWVWYGIMREDWPIIITNSFSALMNGIIMLLQLKYKRNK
ncbi:MAG: SemiSWEET transporter [Chitinophagaceae bacterium]|nr:SemiSWEET transporter [Chitinophagaceae bacterium]